MLGILGITIVVTCEYSNFFPLLILGQFYYPNPNKYKQSRNHQYISDSKFGVLAVSLGSFSHTFIYTDTYACLCMKKEKVSEWAQIQEIELCSAL